MNDHRLSRRQVITTLAAAPFAALAQTPAVTKPDPYADGILIDGEPPLPQEGAFCFAVLPDTQNYSDTMDRRAKGPAPYRGRVSPW
jgi:hypothetical protein